MSAKEVVRRAERACYINLDNREIGLVVLRSQLHEAELHVSNVSFCSCKLGVESWAAIGSPLGSLTRRVFSPGAKKALREPDSTSSSGVGFPLGQTSNMTVFLGKVSKSLARLLQASNLFRVSASVRGVDKILHLGIERIVLG